VIAYAVLIVTYAHPNIEKPLFDPEWLSNGFCVSNIDTPYLSSHDLCLYADTILSVLILGVYLAFRESPGIKGDESLQHSFKWTSVSVLTHGFAHGFISYTIRQKQQNGDRIGATGLTRWEEFSLKRSGNAYDAYMEELQTVIFLLLFWYPLLRSASNKDVKNSVLFILSMVVIAAQFHIPNQFGFTYIQTVISCVFSFNEVYFKPLLEKSRYSYAAMSFVGIPISIIPYWEAMGCSRGWYQALGGHVLYDMSIPIFISLAYVSCYWHEKNTVKNLKKDV
jgi:hypothetical protein